MQSKSALLGPRVIAPPWPGRDLRGRLSSLPGRHPLAVAVGLPAAALVVGLLALAVLTWAEDQAEFWVNHSLRVQAAIARVETLLTTAQADRQAYLLTDRDADLAAAVEAQQQLPAAERSLSDLVQDNPAQVARLAIIVPRIQQALNDLTALRGGAGPAEAGLVGRAAAESDAARGALAGMASEEDQLLGLRVERLQAVRTFSRIALGGAALLGLVGILGARRILADLLDEEARARRDLEAAVRLRDEFLSIAAHELKTPLVSLRLTVGFLRQQVEQGAEPDPAPLRRVLRTADQQIEGLARLVERLLEVSRLRLGRLTLERAPADVAPLVREAVELARARTGRHEIRLAAPAEAWAEVDAGRLQQVLTNLLDNAIKYSPGGGAIDVELGPGPAPGDLRLAVRDRGLGIPPEHRARVFERFYQAHAESHRSGLGIGLYLSRQIVDLHGGRIRLETPEDDAGGTRVVVDLPARTDPRAGPPHA